MRKVALVLLAAGAAVAGCKKKGGSGSPPTSEDQSKDTGRGLDNMTGGKPGKLEGMGSGFGGTGGIDLDGDLEIMAGAIDKDIVRKVVKDHTSKLQYCYEKTLLANPGIAGKVIATFTIAVEGHVSEVKTAGVHPDVEACVADAVKAFKFPPSDKKVDVQYPFSFKPA